MSRPMPLLAALWNRLLSHQTGRWLILGGLVGILCGLAGFIFELGVNCVSVGLLGWAVGLPVHLEGPHVPTPTGLTPTWFALPLVMALGGGISGWLTASFAHDAAGGGTGIAVAAFHRHRGRISPRTTWTKLAASVATLGSGGSAGREGPIALVGAGFGSWCATRLGLSVPDRRTLLVAGTAGGIAAVFHAPLAAALFAAEVLYRGPDLEADTLIPAFIASIVGFITAGICAGAWHGLIGHEALVTGVLFTPPPGLGFRPQDGWHLVGYAAVAVAVAAAAHVFISCYQGVGSVATRLVHRPIVRSALGAGLAGCFGVGVLLGLGALIPQLAAPAHALFGPGYGLVQAAFAESTTGLAWATVLAVLALGKILTTALTVGSGCSGGIFAPALVIGGAIGGAVGAALSGTSWGPPPAAAAVIGMAAFLAVTHRTPVAAILMVSELTGTYGLLIPAMAVVGIAWLLLGDRTVVKEQEKSPWQSRVHQAEGFQDLFATSTVQAVLAPDQSIPTLAPGDSLDACRALVSGCSHQVFPVVHDGRLVGMIRLEDLRQHLYSRDLDDLVVAADLMDGPAAALRPDDTLARALRRFSTHQIEALPVVNADMLLVGLLPRQALFDHYARSVRALAEGGEAGSEDLAAWRRRTAGSQPGTPP